ncbi:hypothetical protein M407DRAFT_24067, partial [Tulasnella calospora MUT 4182]
MADLSHNDLNLTPSDNMIHGARSEQPSEQAKNIFSRLPNELFSIIFSHLLSASDVPLMNHRAPALLIPVCRRFRDLVYCSPDLWTAWKAYRCDNVSLERPVFMRRAGPVLAETHRWSSVVIGMRRPWQSLRFLLPPLEKAPLLTRLSIQQNEEAPHEPPDGLDYVIPDYPKLRVLDISAVCVAPTGVGTTRLQELEVKAKLSDSNAWAALSSFLNRNPAL